MLKAFLKQSQHTRILTLSLALLLAVIGPGIAASPAFAAACPALTNGTVAASVSIPSAATYRIWSHMLAPDTSHTSYYLEIDGANCYLVGHSSSMPVNAWTWISYRDGQPATKLDVNLSAGSHSLKLIGNDAGVKLDRLVFASDLNCVPSGDGSNCDTPADTQAPTVSLTAPAANSVVSGTTAIKANASDNTGGSGISKVEFYVNSALKGTSTSAPYAANWDTTTGPNGSQLIIAKAYDGAGNVSSASYSVTVQNSTPAPPPPPPSNVVVTPTPSNNNVVVTWTPPANSNPTGYLITRNGLPLATVTPNTTSYRDTTAASNTQYNYEVSALDAAGNPSSSSAGKTVTTSNIADKTAPSTPTNVTATAINSKQINLSWTASTDDVSVKHYEIYRFAGKSTAQKIATVSYGTSFGDTDLQPNTEYSYYIKAVDGAGNVSKQSDTKNAKTLSLKRQAVIRGTVTDASGKAMNGVKVILTAQNSRHIYKTNAQGKYVFRGLVAGRYSITFQAPTYTEQTASFKVTDDVIKHDVLLQKK